MTIYEVFYDFIVFLFPNDIILIYDDFIVLNAFIITLLFWYLIILKPLYHIATFFYKKGRR